jgi:hypothetical protein
MPLFSVLKEQNEIISILERQKKGLKPKEFGSPGLRSIDPFWKDLPHCDIFSCFMPDILHQMHKGAFWDHLVSWSGSAAEGGERELDRRFQAMPRHPGLQHFQNGISLISQWRGNEHKEMEKIYLGILAGAVDVEVIRTARALLDFIHYARLQYHTEKTLDKMNEAWSAFHEHKHIFERLDIQEHFNIPKIHSMHHYLMSVKSHGSLNGYNSENPERLHIDFAKAGYNASNKDYIVQMMTWLS